MDLFVQDRTHYTAREHFWEIDSFRSSLVDRGELVPTSRVCKVFGGHPICRNTGLGKLNLEPVGSRLSPLQRSGELRTSTVKNEGLLQEVSYLFEEAHRRSRLPPAPPGVCEARLDPNRQAEVFDGRL